MRSAIRAALYVTAVRCTSHHAHDFSESFGSYAGTSKRAR